jgi:hypothetical protein
MSYGGFETYDDLKRYAKFLAYENSIPKATFLSLESLLDDNKYYVQRFKEVCPEIMKLNLKFLGANLQFKLLYYAKKFINEKQYDDFDIMLLIMKIHLCDMQNLRKELSFIKYKIASMINTDASKEFVNELISYIKIDSLKNNFKERLDDVGKNDKNDEINKIIYEISDIIGFKLYSQLYDSHKLKYKDDLIDDLL